MEVDEAEAVPDGEVEVDEDDVLPDPEPVLPMRAGFSADVHPVVVELPEIALYNSQSPAAVNVTAAQFAVSSQLVRQASIAAAEERFERRLLLVIVSRSVPTNCRLATTSYMMPFGSV